MTIDHDREADAIYITLSADPITRNESLDTRRSIDYGVDGAVVGIEFLWGSEGVDLTDIPHADEIRPLLEGEGIEVTEAVEASEQVVRLRRERRA